MRNGLIIIEIPEYNGPGVYSLADQNGKQSFNTIEVLLMRKTDTFRKPFPLIKCNLRFKMV